MTQPPFGLILYYIYCFVIMVVLLNVLIALYNSAYEDITDNATDEYLALVCIILPYPSLAADNA